ncbi:MAG: hypothetical protein EBU08_08085 [Micrococcales bacterium]|nr:hypothetical protein [Micrococcales bacterium]
MSAFDWKGPSQITPELKKSAITSQRSSKALQESRSKGSWANTQWKLSNRGEKRLHTKRNMG